MKAAVNIGVKKMELKELIALYDCMKSLKEYRSIV